MAKKMALVFFIIFLSCSGSRPQVNQVFWQMNFVKNLTAGVTDEQLVVFFVPADDDGLDDIEQAYLINDASGLHWELNRASWMSQQVSGAEWLGHPAISMPDSAPLPRGLYRLYISDRAGLNAAREFYVNTDSNLAKNAVFPSMEKDAQSLRIISGRPVELRVYSRSGDLVYTNYLSPGTYAWDLAVPTISLRNPDFYCALYQYDEATGTGLIVYPYDFPSVP
jgi:hypothetical protein